MTIELEITHSEDYGTVKGKLTGEDPGVIRSQLDSAEFDALLTAAVTRQKLLADEMKLTHGLGDRPQQVLTGSGSPFDSTQPNPQFASSIPQQQAAQPPAWAQPQPANVVPISQGRVCESCGQPLIAKQTSAGKKVWRCDAWRWNNGNPNNHTSLKPGEGF